jgi:hypothetical protein
VDGCGSKLVVLVGELGGIVGVVIIVEIQFSASTSSARCCCG